jgi:hypothetical protein
MSKCSRKPDARDLAAEIVRRCAEAGVSAGYVVAISDSPTTSEPLQLATARILRRPIAIVPTKCKSIAEWLGRFGRS